MRHAPDSRKPSTNCSAGGPALTLEACADSCVDSQVCSSFHSLTCWVLCTAGVLYTVLPGHNPVAAGEQGRCCAPLHQLCQCHRVFWLCGHPHHWLAAGPEGVWHHPRHHQLHRGHLLCAASHSLTQVTGMAAMWTLLAAFTDTNQSVLCSGSEEQAGYIRHQKFT